MTARRVSGRPPALLLAALLCLAVAPAGSSIPPAADPATDTTMSFSSPDVDPVAEADTTPEPTRLWALAEVPPPAPPVEAPSPAPTAAPTKAPAPTARTAPKPATEPTTVKPKPKPKPASKVKTVTVSSIAALKSTLRDNSVGLIIVRNGTYHVSPASLGHSDSLWIAGAYAKRTRAVTVRAQTRGRVTFDGGGTSSFGCISFAEGARYQTWDGFNCANGRANQTGIITFGGYAGKAAPHHITMRYITIKSSCRGSATSASAPVTDHAFYISMAAGGPHHLTFSTITVDGRGGLASAFHFYHSSGSSKNAWAVSIRGLHVIGTQQAVMLWDPTLLNISIVGATITNAQRFAVRFEGGAKILLSHIKSTGSGDSGFHSSKGSKPAGVTFVSDSFH